MGRCVALVIVGLTAASTYANAAAHGSQDPFAVAGLTRPEVTLVLSELQTAVASGDAARVSKLVQFPLTVNGKPGPKNPREFIRDFDTVFTDVVRAAVLKQSVERLFANWRGLMIGRGEVWLSGICDHGSSPDTCENSRILVISINNNSR
jgi:hypothetical protein